MTGYHRGLEVFAECLGEDHRVEEYGGLGYFGLTEVFVSACKHQVGDAEAENLVCLLEHFLGYFIAFIEVFAHSYELGALTGEYVSFH